MLRERRVLLTVRAFATRVRTCNLNNSFLSKNTPSQYNGPVASCIMWVLVVIVGLLAGGRSARYYIKWINSDFLESKVIPSVCPYWRASWASACKLLQLSCKLLEIASRTISSI